MGPGLVRFTDFRAIQIIRNFQGKEGNFPCFKTGNFICSQFDCCWREICLDEFHVRAAHILDVVDN